MTVNGRLNFLLHFHIVMQSFFTTCRPICRFVTQNREILIQCIGPSLLFPCSPLPLPPRIIESNESHSIPSTAPKRVKTLQFSIRQSSSGRSSSRQWHLTAGSIPEGPASDPSLLSASCVLSQNFTFPRPRHSSLWCPNPAHHNHKMLPLQNHQCT